MKPGRPVATIDVDGRALQAEEAACLHVAVDARLGCHDTVSMAFWPGSKFAGARPGAKVGIRLGTKEDGDEEVCAGEVTSVRQAVEAVHLDAIAPTFALSRVRKSQTYLSQPVADIVKDLAGAVEVDEVEADVTLESYSVDTRRSVWGHLRDLAWLAAADLGCAPSGALRFVKIRAGSATRRYRYRHHLLQWQVFAAAATTPPAVAPHAAASEAGKAKWHWILHDPGAAADKATKVIGGFQTRDAADNLSAALGERAKRGGARGTLLLLGDAAVRPGAVVEVSDVPDFDPGPLRVLGVRHRFDAVTGFRTQLTVEGGGGGVGLGL